MASPAMGFAKAVQAYNNVAKGDSFSGQVRRGHPAAVGAGEDFANLVKGAIDEAIKIGQRSESLSIKGVNDRADLTQVVTAVAEAEVTLQTVVAVRDKVLEAYKDIIRMPI